MHADAKVASRLEQPAIDLDSAELPPELISRYISLRKRALASCYERELKAQTGLAGRVLVRLAIALDGRARSVEVVDEGLGSAAVVACIRSTVERWAFPAAPQSEVSLAFPLIFAPAL